jgi:ribosomal protein S18 acetylase RimI-like enzyme
MDDKYALFPITQKQSSEILQLANHIFGFGSSLLISKKNMWGYYATDGEQISGAVLLEKGSENEGFLAWIFIAEHARGHKLASRLIEKGFKALDDAGLIIQFALVRDDNTASWNMFYKAGYKVLPLYKTLFSYSFKGLSHRLNYMFLSGYSIWVKDDSKTDPTYPKYPITRTLLSALLIGASIALFGLRDIQFLYITILMVLSITILRILVAYPIARTSGKVRFMPSQGGYILSLILALLFTTWWPTFGFFAPKQDLWKDSEYKANIGQQALATWMTLNAIFIGTALLFNDIFTQGLHVLLLLILVYQLIPSWPPFDAFDGSKVIRWNKTMYFIGLIITAITISLTYIILF